MLSGDERYAAAELLKVADTGLVHDMGGATGLGPPLETGDTVGMAGDAAQAHVPTGLTELAPVAGLKLAPLDAGLCGSVMAGLAAGLRDVTGGGTTRVGWLGG